MHSRKDERRMTYGFGPKDGLEDFVIRKGYSKEPLPGDDLKVCGEYLEVIDNKSNVLFRVRVKALKDNPRYKTVEDILRFLLDGADIKNLDNGTVNVSNSASRRMREICDANRYRYANKDENGGLRKGRINR